MQHVRSQREAAEELRGSEIAKSDVEDAMTSIRAQGETAAGRVAPLEQSLKGFEASPELLGRGQHPTGAARIPIQARGGRSGLAAAPGGGGGRV